MRTRRWILFVFSLLLIGIVSLIHGWRLFKANERIRDFILTEVRPFLGEDCNIGRARISLSNIHLEKVTLRLPNHRLFLYVEDLRIGFDPFRLLGKGFDPKAIFQDVLLVNPRLIISLGSDSLQAAETDFSHGGLRLGAIKAYGQKATWLKFLRRLSIKDGEMFFQEPGNRLTRVANAVEGSLTPDGSESTGMRLSGKVFDSRDKNLLITCEADATTGLIRHVQVSLKNYNLKDHIPVLMPEMLRFVDGRLNAFFDLAAVGQGSRELKLDGELSITQASAQLRNGMVDLEDINVKADIRDWHLQLAQCSLLVNDSPLSLAGSISDLSNPVLALEAHCPQLNVASFASWCGKRLKGNCAGQADVLLKIHGPINDIRLDADFSSRYIWLNALSLRRIHFSSSYQNQRLTISRCTATTAQNNFAYSGEIDFSDLTPTVSGSISMTGDIASLLRPFAAESLLACKTAFSGRISGALANPLLTGDLTAKLFAHPADSLQLTTQLSVQNSSITFLGGGGNGLPSLTGYFDFAGASPKFALRFENIERLPCILWKLPFEPEFTENLALYANIRGKPGEFSTGVEIKRKRPADSKSDLAVLQAEVKRDRQGVHGTGHIWLYPIGDKELTGHFSFKKDQESFVLSDLDLGHEMSAAFAMKATGSGVDSLAGKLSINDFKLTSFLISPDLVCTGNLDGRIEIAGTKQNPVLTGNLQADDMFYNQVGPYGSEMSFHYQDGVFSIEKFSLNSSEATLLYASGNYHLPQDSLDFSVKGAGFDIKALAAALGEKHNYFTGRSLVDLKVIGPLLRPQIVGFCAIKQGSVFAVPFDELEMRLGEREAKNVQDWPEYPAVDLSRLRISRQNEFEIVGSGFIPLSSEDSLRLQLDGKGNFLVILHDIVDYFGNSSSAGVLSARLSGTLTNPTLEEASLSFHDGRMEFQSVVPIVTEARGRIEFESAEQFVHVLDLQGKMGGDWFRISNTLADDELAARPMENLVLHGSGFNFGVTMLETSERGVPLNVVGLQEKGVFGHAEFIGRNAEEKFYFAGPAERPLVRGRVNLYGVELMYPMEVSDQPINEFVTISFGASNGTFLPLPPRTCGT